MSKEAATSPTLPPKPATQRAPPLQPQPSAPKHEPVRAKAFAEKISAKYPDTKVEWMTERRLKVTTPPGRAKELASFAKSVLGFDHISTVSGVDWIARNELEVVYFVGSSTPGQEDFILALSERVARDNPVVPTLVDIWVGAEYHERETHEMFGINFQGHPDQSHLFLPEDWNDLPPLRKDYVSPGR
jgi:NADH:ubiquinone oxidoreductase subunit C